jgi:hypothetical protein
VQELGVNADDQHLLVVGPVEDADPAALRQVARGAPEEVVLQLGGAGVLEAEHLAALRIDPGHDVPDGAVLPRRVHRLKDQQDRMAVRGVVELLLGAQLLDVVLQQRLVLVLRFVDGIDLRRPFLEIDLVAFGHAKVLGVDFHLVPFGRGRFIRRPAGSGRLGFAACP